MKLTSLEQCCLWETLTRIVSMESTDKGVRPGLLSRFEASLRETDRLVTEELVTGYKGSDGVSGNQPSLAKVLYKAEINEKPEDEVVWGVTIEGVVDGSRNHMIGFRWSHISNSTYATYLLFI
ncbi:hypothetical protein YC2023_104210 [Brassica napus]|uniref:(rape) hypothetical protein n=1 Tax=Brassica napus TaxID=3708 RepID=A0A816V1U5_BRANA|nr:unnamed protein product [Brassica napus]